MRNDENGAKARFLLCITLAMHRAWKSVLWFAVVLLPGGFLLLPLALRFATWSRTDASGPERALALASEENAAVGA